MSQEGGYYCWTGSSPGAGTLKVSALKGPSPRRPAAASASERPVGSRRNQVITTAAMPTIDRGFCRIAVKAPSNMSPSLSGRSATMPGLCTGTPVGPHCCCPVGTNIGGPPGPDGGGGGGGGGGGAADPGGGGGEDGAGLGPSPGGGGPEGEVHELSSVTGPFHQPSPHRGARICTHYEGLTRCSGCSGGVAGARAELD